ncbi:MAG: hypothetical protein PHQ60_12145 [Sideroxydans sp.]|nr:hypothetical protein [Sideroxydans sp.]
MSNKDKILGTDEAWESEELGADEKHVRVVDGSLANQIDESLGLQMISIRLDKGLIDSFKTLGTFHGVGYQPLMRDALKRFAECEMKAIVSGLVESQRQQTLKSPAVKATPSKEKKAA